MEEKREIIYSDISGMLRRGNFDVMIYKDGSKIVAIDSAGRNISSGVAATDDTAVIQCAIGSLPETGGVVSIQRDTYNLTSTITVPKNCELCFNGSTIDVRENVNCFILKPGSSITDVTIETRSISFTQTCILLLTSDRHSVVYEKYTRIHDVKFFGEYGLNSGTAIHFYGDGEGYIWGADTRSIFVRGFEYGIKIEIPQEEREPLMWINGNTFENLYGLGTMYFIHISRTGSDLYDLDNNRFSNIQFQFVNHAEIYKDAEAITAITVRGRYSSFKGVMIWDWWATQRPQVIFDEYSRNNVMEIYVTDSTNAVQDNGIGNVITKVNMFDPIPTDQARVIHVGKNHQIQTIKHALSLITNPSQDNQYTIVAHGEIVDTGVIYWKPHTHLVGVGLDWTIATDAASRFPSLYFLDVTNAVFENATIRISNPGHVEKIWFDDSVDDTVVFNNVHFVVNPTVGTTDSVTIIVRKHSNPVFNNCHIVASQGCNSVACVVKHAASPTFNNCTIEGAANNGEYNTRAMSIHDSASPILTGCNIVGGVSETGSATTVLIANAAAPILTGCTIINGIGNNSSAIAVGGGARISASPCFNGCTIMYPVVSKQYIYPDDFPDSTDGNITILPIENAPYFIHSIYVYVHEAVAGSTLNIGTTPGGSEIAANVSTGVWDVKYFPYNRESLNANEPIYITLSDPNVGIHILLSVGANREGSRGVYLNTHGYARFSNCKIYANKASSAVYIPSTTSTMVTKTFRIDNCSLESAGSYDLECASEGVIPIYNCTFGSGRIMNAILPGRGTIKLTAGNTTVTTKHGYTTAPNSITITPASNPGNATKWWISNINDTEFTVSVDSDPGSDVNFYWRAEM